MRDVYKILLFAVSNLIGILASPILLNAAIFLGRIPTVSGGSSDAFKFWFITMTLCIWMPCGIASLGAFFTEGRTRFMLLFVPAVVPLIYGLAALIGFGYPAVAR